MIREEDRGDVGDASILLTSCFGNEERGQRVLGDIDEEWRFSGSGRVSLIVTVFGGCSDMQRTCVGGWGTRGGGKRANEPIKRAGDGPPGTTTLDHSHHSYLGNQGLTVVRKRTARDRVYQTGRKFTITARQDAGPEKSPVEVSLIPDDGDKKILHKAL